MDSVVKMYFSWIGSLPGVLKFLSPVATCQNPSLSHRKTILITLLVVTPPYATNFLATYTFCPSAANGHFLEPYFSSRFDFPALLYEFPNIGIYIFTLSWILVVF
jgi:hypothetical protein